MTDKTEAPEAEVEEPEVGTNPLTLPWPQDPEGALSALKKGGVHAAKRVNGKPERLENFMAVLRILAKHAHARFEMDTAARQKAKVNHVSARARVAERQKIAAEEKAREYEKAAKRVRENAGIKTEG